MYELRQDIFPCYSKVRKHFATEFGIVKRAVKDEVSFILVSHAVNTPFALFHTLTRNDLGKPSLLKLKERAKLSDTLLAWSEQWRLSPRFWQNDEWFLDVVVKTLESWYQFPDHDTQLTTGLGYESRKAESNVCIKNKRQFLWDLTSEGRADFKKRVIEEIAKEISTQVDAIYPELLEKWTKQGFSKSESRRTYERDMSWLVAYQCFGKTWDELAKTLPPDKSLDTVRKAVEGAC